METIASVPEAKLQLILDGFNLTNQGVGIKDLTAWYQKAYHYNGALTFIATLAALIKIQGAVNQNTDLLLNLKEKIEQGSEINQTLVNDVQATRNINMADFVNSLFAVVEEA
nr:hypothetical protein 23 [bacterium]